MPDAKPFILTLAFDPPTFAVLNALRVAHLPPERNLIPAHLTLFHALPGDQQQVISETLARIASSTPPFDLELPSLRFLGRGVAVNVVSAPLIALRMQLAKLWQPWLSPQDSQPFRPHITIQNKVAPEVARQLYEQCSATWQPCAGQAVGLLLWRYCGGPWELRATLPFTASPLVRVARRSAV